jgi:excisionase family DNA binding protein
MKPQVSATEQDRLLTEPEVCEYLRIRPRQLYTWRMEGMIPYFKIGKALRFRKSDIDATLEKLRIAG